MPYRGSNSNNSSRNSNRCIKRQWVNLVVQLGVLNRQVRIIRLWVLENDSKYRNNSVKAHSVILMLVKLIIRYYLLGFWYLDEESGCFEDWETG